MAAAAVVYVPAVVAVHLLALLWLYAAPTARFFARAWSKGPRTWSPSTTPKQRHTANKRRRLQAHQIKPSTSSPVSSPPRALLPALTWNSISYSVVCRGGKHIHPLLNVSGAAVVGLMQAVIGPSGAGKSTLLELLARGPPPGSLSHSSAPDAGNAVNASSRASQLGAASHAAVWKCRSLLGSCGQEEILLPTLSVGESATFAYQMAHVSNHGGSKDTPKLVLERLGLAGVWDVKVGGVLAGGMKLRGISGGERKRLAIATQLLSMPPPASTSSSSQPPPAVTTLLIDEPTSGLDATCAMSVMKYLRTLASSSIDQLCAGSSAAAESNAGGTAVVATIHQPRPSIWAQFDTCTVLAAGGMPYFGPCDQLASYFEQGALRSGKLPAFNPQDHGAVPDYVLEMLAGSVGGGGSASKGREKARGAQQSVWGEEAGPASVASSSTEGLQGSPPQSGPAHSPLPHHRSSGKQGRSRNARAEHRAAQDVEREAQAVLHAVQVFQEEATAHMQGLMQGPHGVLWWLSPPHKLQQQPTPCTPQSTGKARNQDASPSLSHSPTACSPLTTSSPTADSTMHEPWLLKPPPPAAAVLTSATVTPKPTRVQQTHRARASSSSKQRQVVLAEQLRSLPAHTSWLKAAGGVDEAAQTASAPLQPHPTSTTTITNTTSDDLSTTSLSSIRSAIGGEACYNKPPTLVRASSTPSCTDLSSAASSSLLEAQSSRQGCGLLTLCSSVHNRCPCRSCRKQPAHPPHPHPGVTASISITATAGRCTLQQQKQEEPTPSNDSTSLWSSCSSMLGRMGSSGLACSRQLIRSAYVTYHHFTLLTWREYLQLYANPMEHAMKLCLFAWAAIVVGLVFYDLGEQEGLTGVRLRLSTLLMSSGVLISMPYMSLLAYTADTAHATKEAADGLYGPFPYLLAKLASTVPLHIACAAAYASITYGMQGLRMSDHPGTSIPHDGGFDAGDGITGGGRHAIACHIVLSVLLVLVASQFVHLAVAAAPSPDMAFGLSTLWAMINLFFSGFFINPDELSIKDLGPLKYFSAVRLAYRGGAVLELQGRHFECGPTAGTVAAILGGDWGQASRNVIHTIFKFLGLDSSTSTLLLSRLEDLPADNNSNSSKPCVLDGNALVAVLGLGSSIQVEGATEGSGTTEGQASLVGHPLEPWGQAGYMAVYFTALVCTTYVIIAFKWPRRRLEVTGA